MFIPNRNRLRVSAAARTVSAFSGPGHAVFPVVLVALFCAILFSGCSASPDQPEEATPNTEAPREKPPTPMTEIPNRVTSKTDDSTICAYWKCSVEKALYMQRYTKNDMGKYRPSGAFKLNDGDGVGAFPLTDLDKYRSDGEAVSLDNGSDVCPYCKTHGLCRCSACGKTSCGGMLDSQYKKKGPMIFTCPWCGNSGEVTPSSWNVGGNGE